MSHPVDALWEYALGSLTEAEREEVARHVAGCPACAVQLRDAEEALAMVGLDLPPVAPSPRVFDRLMASTQGPFEGVLDKVSRMWDLGRDQVRALFDWMKTAGWEPSGIPGVDLLHVTPGPAAAHADAGYVRYAPGTQFPAHEHMGDELQLIMEGVIVDDSGTTFRVGDTMFKPLGSSHAFNVGPDGCLIALSLVGGIVIGGVKYGAGS
jgi:anti-sigma factor ChrR (cupin superfamily)